jgi:hypothetical protein
LLQRLISATQCPLPTLLDLYLAAFSQITERKMRLL